MKQGSRGRPHNQKPSVQNAWALEVLELRRDGYTLAEIAEKLDIAESTVSRRLANGLALAAQDVGEESLLIELVRLEWLWRELAQDIKDLERGPDRTAAILAALKVMERKARYLGLDAPTKVQAQILTIDAVEAAIVALEQQLGPTGTGFVGEAPALPATATPSQ